MKTLVPAGLAAVWDGGGLFCIVCKKFQQDHSGASLIDCQVPQLAVKSAQDEPPVLQRLLFGYLAAFFCHEPLERPCKRDVLLLPFDGMGFYQLLDQTVF